MSWEGLWYQMYDSATGKAPHCLRLCRRPMAEQWRFVIDMAIEFSEGLAGYRLTRHSPTGETYWFVGGQWWMIPPRIEKRCQELNNAAVQYEIRRGRGQCDSAAVTERLKSWRDSGYWRKVAAKIYPRHVAATVPRMSKRRKKTRERIEEMRQRLRPATVDPNDCNECPNGHHWPMSHGDECPACGEYFCRNEQDRRQVLLHE